MRIIDKSKKINKAIDDTNKEGMYVFKFGEYYYFFQMVSKSWFDEKNKARKSELKQHIIDEGYHVPVKDRPYNYTPIKADLLDKVGTLLSNNKILYYPYKRGSMYFRLSKIRKFTKVSSKVFEAMGSDLVYKNF